MPLWSEYALSSNIHGLAELVRLPIRLRFMWLGVLLIVVVLTAYQSWSLVSTWSAEPIVTYAMNYERMDEHFPTITFCPSTSNKYKPGSEVFGNAENCSFEWPGFAHCEPEVPYWTKWNEVVRDIRNDTPSVQVFGHGTRTCQQQHSMLYYLESMWPFTYPKSILYQVYCDSADWDKVKKFFWAEFIGPNKTLLEKHMEITIDFDTAILEQPGYPLKNKQKVMTYMGVCFAFDAAFTMSSLLMKPQDVKFAVRKNDELSYIERVNSGTAPIYVNADHIYAGEPTFWKAEQWAFVPTYQNTVPFPLPDDWLNAISHGTNYLGATVVNVNRDYNIELLVSSITFTRLNLRRRPCKDWSDDERQECTVKCFNDEFCSKMTDTLPCLIYHPNQTKEEQYMNVCSFLDGEMYYTTQKSNHCALKILNGSPFDQTCDDRCPKKCIEHVYYYTHKRVLETIFYQPDISAATNFTLPARKVDGNYWANVSLRYYDSTRNLKIQESSGMRGYSFAAELGSAVALWTGASGLALAELLMWKFVARNV